MPNLASGEGAALVERFRRYLREHRQPITRQRDLVAQVVLLSEDHPSVDGIRRTLKERGEHVGTATVYRTLEVLVESGLVRAHDFGEGFKRYEPMPAQAHHEHLICERCGRGRGVPERAARADAADHRRRARLSARSATGSRSTACAGSAVSASWPACERAREPRAARRLRRRAPELPVALRASAGPVLHRLPDRDDAARDRRPAPGRAGARAAVRARLFARVRAARGQRHRARARAQLLPAVAPAHRRRAHHRLRAGVSRRHPHQPAVAGAAGAGRAQAGRLPGLGAGGHGVRGGVDAVHRAGARRHPRTGRDHQRSLARHAAAGGLLGRARRAVPDRGARAGLVSRTGSSASGAISRGSCG